MEIKITYDTANKAGIKGQSESIYRGTEKQILKNLLSEIKTWEKYGLTIKVNSIEKWDL